MAIQAVSFLFLLLPMLFPIFVVCSAGGQAGTTPAVSAASLTAMTSSDLTSQLSAVKDNSLVVSNKIISGPLKIDGEQQAITPVTFKVEFRDCEFTDKVLLRKVTFAQSVTLLRVKFDQGVDLESIHVQSDLRLEMVQAAKLIQMNQSQVDGDVHIKDPVAPGIQMENLTANNLLVGLGKHSIATLDFMHLTTGRFSLTGASDPIAKIDQLELGNANLRETLTLQNVEIPQAGAANLTVTKRVVFLPVTRIQKLNFTSANLGSFEWTFAGRVELPQKLDIDGATFGALNVMRVPAAGTAKSADEARRFRSDRTDYGLAFLERAEYYEPAYTAYESSLKTRGQSDKANDVYFAMRDRRRYIELVDASSLTDKIVGAVDYVIGFGHKWLFGYGRAWVYPLMWCVAFVLLGAVIFRDSDRMQRVDEDDSSRGFSPIWYSLDTSVPILSLGVAKCWRPKEEYRLLYFYSKFLSLIGLIFLSAMVGALTGTLK